MKTDALVDGARAVLAGNDMGPFFRPGRELYPHQWNWDSAFIALGLAHVDPERGRAEVRSLLRGQWSDGMVPHIVFHIPAPDYSPGPELWDSRACEGAPEVPTSGLTQPPVLATAVRVLHEASPDRSFLEEVVPALERWHEWLHRERSTTEGLIAIVHPWEGADNSPRFDRALARLDVDDELDIERTDRREIDSSERPTDSDYARYLFLVRRLQAQGYRPPSLEDTPFVFVDLTFNSILARAEADLAWLCGRDRRGRGAGERGGRRASSRRSPARWNESRAIYVEDDGDADGGGRDHRRALPALCGRADARAGAPSLRGGAMGTDSVRPLARGAVGRDVGLEGEPRVRSASLLARPGLGERELVLRPGPRAGRPARTRRTSSDG